MKLKVKRLDFQEFCTIGALSIDGEFFCHTLEDKVRDVKIKGETAIPAGTYKAIINMSNRFKKLMPLLLNVPNYEGVRIHSGNTHHDTEGCILVGMGKTKDSITSSREAFEKLMAKLKDQKDITITIE